MNEFIDQMNALRNEYGFCIGEDCDLWSRMTGFMFYKTEESDRPFAHITGVRYKEDGSCLEGDFAGVLKLMKEAVISEYS